MIVIHDDDAKNSSEVNGAVYSVYQTERNKFDYYNFLDINLASIQNSSLTENKVLSARTNFS